MNWLVALLIFVHLFATVAWIGGVVFMMLVFMPVLGRRKEFGPMAGILTVDVAKRFMALVWASIALFLITGFPMTINNPRFPGFIDLSNLWSTAILIKHIAVAAMVIGAAAQTFIIRRMGKILGASQKQPPAMKSLPSLPSPELMKLRQRQLVIGIMVFILGVLVLLLTAIAETAFIPG